MTERGAYLSRLAELLGERLTRVRYMELQVVGNPEVEPQWNSYADHDTLDFGVELSFESGLVRRLEWCNAFDWHTVSQWDGPFEGASENPRFDVSRGSRWEPLVGRTVTRVETDGFTATLSRAGEVERSEFQSIGPVGDWAPYAVALTFEGGAFVLIATYEFDGERARGALGSDHVSVFFDDAAARAHGVIPFANPD